MPTSASYQSNTDFKARLIRAYTDLNPMVASLYHFVSLQVDHWPSPDDRLQRFQHETGLPAGMLRTFMQLCSRIGSRQGRTRQEITTRFLQAIPVGVKDFSHVQSAWRASLANLIRMTHPEFSDRDTPATTWLLEHGDQALIHRAIQTLILLLETAEIRDVTAYPKY